MLQAKQIDFQTNIQCQCFSTPTPSFKFFLSRSTVLQPQLKQTPSYQHPSLLQSANTTTSLKKSLKTPWKPYKNSEGAHQKVLQSFTSKSNQSQADDKSGVGECRAWNEGKRWFQVAKSSGKGLQQNKGVFLPSQPFSTKTSFLAHTLPSHPKVFTLGSSAHPQVIFCVGGQIMKKSSAVVGKLGDDKNEKKDGVTPMTKCSSARQLKTISDSHTSQPIGLDSFQKSKRRMHTEDPQQQSFQFQVKLASGQENNSKEKVMKSNFYSCNLKQELKKVPTEKLKNSLIKHKPKEGPIKFGKHHKHRTVLRKMSDVSQINSLADEEDLDDSDQESVVLGRLNEYSMHMHYDGEGIPQLDRDYEDSSISSTVLTVPPKGPKPLFLQRTLI